MDSKAHWNGVYADKSPDQLTWHQEVPRPSLELIAATGIAADDAIIDAGGGMSFLVEALLDAGYQDVTVLDIAGKALDSSKERLGELAGDVTWLERDLLAAGLPEDRYALWHDRAVFHFLTDDEARQQYVATVRRSLQPGGHVILATFAVDGPQRCSGLDSVRYGAEEIEAVFGDAFRLVGTVDALHHTPWESTQRFTYFHLTAVESSAD